VATETNPTAKPFPDGPTGLKGLAIFYLSRQKHW